MSTSKYSIAQLAELTNVSRRTVRYYIQRGLLSPPLGSGRGSHYNEAHLSRLIQIRDLQLKGIPLAEIDSVKTPKTKNTITLPIEKWTRILISQGVELHLCNHILSEEQLDTIRKTIALLLPLNKESNHE